MNALRAAILVPAPDYHEAWNWAYDVEAAALERAGLVVEPRCWVEPGDLAAFDLVLPLVAWGYNRDPSRWHALLDRLEQERAATVNPVALLRWNSDKFYLTELAAKGIATVPTRFAEMLDENALDAARREFGVRLVIKPPVSAAADGTFLIEAADPIPEEVRGKPMMIQPFLKSVTSEGEYSLIYFGGRFSHCLLKRPRSGDYRVQPHLGGHEEPCAPPPGAIELAAAALGAAPAPPAYARVDLIRLDTGSLAVIELELIEPALWLQHTTDQGSAFAAAVLAQAQI